jgi:hypothetical protein
LLAGHQAPLANMSRPPQRMKHSRTSPSVGVRQGVASSPPQRHAGATRNAAQAGWWTQVGWMGGSLWTRFAQGFALSW